MESARDYIDFYSYLGMPPREIGETLGIPLSSVYRNLKFSDTGKRTLHYFPDVNTSNSQLARAEQNRQLNAQRHHIRNKNGPL